MQLSLTLMKSSQTTLIPPEGHCQNNKQLGFFKESYLSWTGEQCVHACVCVCALCTYVCVQDMCISTDKSSLLIGSSSFIKRTVCSTLRTSSLLFRADPLGRRQPPLNVLLSAGGHLDAHLHWNGPSTQLQRPGPGRDGNAHDSTGLPRLGEGPQSVSRTPAQTSLVLDENQDIAQREVGLALATGQQIMLRGSRPPRAGGGWRRRWRSRP